MNSAHGNASMEQEKTCLETTTVKDDEHGLPKPKNEPIIEEDALCLSFSSSDTSSEEDFFQLDAVELSKMTTRHGEMPSNNLRPPQLGENAQSEAAVTDPAGKLEVKSLSQDESTLAGSVQAGQVSLETSFSPCGNPGSDYVGAKQSPLVQVMGKSDDYDPSRIPSAVFTRTKSTAPMEWSVASNESLFSIQMGRSGELTSDYNGQWDGYPPISPLPGSSPAQSAGAGLGLAEPSVAEAANAEAMKDVLRAAAEEKGKPLAGGVPRSDSKHSDSSVNSYRSFAFPILTDGKNESIKVGSVHQHTSKERPQPESDPPKAVPDAAEKKWFPCFSCCPFCC
ncbi:putative Dihydrodipicolinate synthase [Cocos nucifera]|uniref:Putative Dihydrodipicolinate synthase n=1 Tax=Cocos nucifera TaxID=13894 RepID=A0A8K0HYH5_COCNU|nr:putative Dihydrodipicolinate synthase [Cocos nucifera]